MTFFQKQRRFTAIYLAAAMVPLLLTGCASELGPYPLPTGYKYQNEEYKTPPGPEPIFKGSDGQEAAAPMMDTTSSFDRAPSFDPLSTPRLTVDTGANMNSGGWQQPANDLVGRLVATLGQPTDGVFLAPVLGQAPNIGLESALRTAMAANGLTVVSTGGGAFSMEYSVIPLGYDSGQRVMLSVRMLSGGKIAKEESGIYTVDDVSVPAPSEPPMTQSLTGPEQRSYLPPANTISSPVSTDDPMPLGAYNYN